MVQDEFAFFLGFQVPAVSFRGGVFGICLVKTGGFPSIFQLEDKEKTQQK